MSNEVIQTTNATSFFENIDISSIAIQFFYIVGVAASILGALYLITRVFGIKISETLLTSFFDADKGNYVQDRSYSVKWGSAFKRSIHLPHKFNSGSKLEIWYKPTTGPMDDLTEEHYTPITKSNETKIDLSDKAFYKDEEVEKIRVKTTTRINHQKLDKLMSKISVKVENDRIIITNKNEEKIRNYPIIMPSSIPASKGWEYVNTIDGVVTYRIVPKSTSDEQSLTLLVDLSKNSEGGQLELPILS